MSENEKNYFTKLYSIDCSGKTEKKNGLTYLSWAWAWAEVKKLHPDSQYTIYENKDGWNYHTDGRTCWVKTGVTVDGLEHIEYLPVMDYKNRSIPADMVTSFDVNKAIQRSLTKAAARHGLGLYIYAGEDLPESEEEQPKQKLTPFEPVPVKPEVPEEVKRASKIQYNGISLGKIFKNDKALFAELITSGDDEIMEACTIISKYMQERK